MILKENPDHSLCLSKKNKISDVLHIFHDMGFMGNKIDFIMDFLYIYDLMLLLMLTKRRWKECCASDYSKGVI